MFTARSSSPVQPTGSALRNRRKATRRLHHLPATHGVGTQSSDQVKDISGEGTHGLGVMTLASTSVFAAGFSNEKKLTGNVPAGVPASLRNDTESAAMDKFTTSEVATLKKQCVFWEIVADEVPFHAGEVGDALEAEGVALRTLLRQARSVDSALEI